MSSKNITKSTHPIHLLASLVTRAVTGLAYFAQGIFWAQSKNDGYYKLKPKMASSIECPHWLRPVHSSPLPFWHQLTKNRSLVLVALSGLFLNSSLAVFFLACEFLHGLLHLPLLLELQKSREAVVMISLIHIQIDLQGSVFLEDVLVVTLEPPAQRQVLLHEGVFSACLHLELRLQIGKQVAILVAFTHQCHPQKYSSSHQCLYVSAYSWVGEIEQLVVHIQSGLCMGWRVEQGDEVVSALDGLVLTTPLDDCYSLCTALTLLTPYCPATAHHRVQRVVLQRRTHQSYEGLLPSLPHQGSVCKQETINAGRGQQFQAGESLASFSNICLELATEGIIGSEEDGGAEFCFLRGHGMQNALIKPNTNSQYSNSICFYKSNQLRLPTSHPSTLPDHHCPTSRSFTSFPGSFVCNHQYEVPAWFKKGLYNMGLNNVETTERMS